MKPEKDGFKSKFKSYHIFLLSCILCSIFVLNSNAVKDRKINTKLIKEKSQLFFETRNKRLLQQNLTPNEGNSDAEDRKINSEKVCSKCSDELIKYYETWDLPLIGLSDEKFVCENKDEKYMKALFGIVRKFTEDNDTNIEDNIVNYGLHILPFLVFLVIGIFSIFGWIVCCVCTCGDCFCCCCCKKVACKNPCFVVTYIFYIVAIIVSINALTKSKKIFKGLANTECTMLRFIQEVLDEELKQSEPKWEGIANIKSLIANLKTKINDLSNNSTVIELNNKNAELKNNKSSFRNESDKFAEDYYNEGKYHDDYTTTFSNISLTDYKDKKYVLEIIENIGHVDSETNKFTHPSFLDSLNSSYSEVDNKAIEDIQTSLTSFDSLNKNSSDLNESIEKAEDMINSLEKTFNKLHDKIGKKISDYSDSIEDNGKLVLKIVFIGLIVINIVLAILLICICVCSMKACTSCCLFRCLFKCCTHLLWNILALMMITSLLFGSLLSLSGKVGEDAISLIYYVLSEENFNSNCPLLLNELKDDKKYLNICLYENGNIENELEVGESFNTLEDLEKVLNRLDNITQEFKELKSNSFNSFKEEIKNITEFLTPKIVLSGVSDENSGMILSDILFKLNNETKHLTNKKEIWDINGNKTITCDFNPDPSIEYVFHPSSCKPIDREWIQGYNDSSLKDYAKIISNIVDLVKNLDKDSFKNSLNNFEESYIKYLNSFIEMLGFLKSSINPIIGEIKEKTKNESLFSFLNIKFIGTNFRIILKYLKYTLGHDFYNLGIYLIVIGCSLIFSISSTILLIVIINVYLKENIESEKKPVVPSEKRVLKSRNNTFKDTE